MPRINRRLSFLRRTRSQNHNSSSCDKELSPRSDAKQPKRRLRRSHDTLPTKRQRRRPYRLNDVLENDTIKCDDFKCLNNKCQCFEKKFSPKTFLKHISGKEGVNCWIKSFSAENRFYCQTCVDKNDIPIKFLTKAAYEIHCNSQNCGDNVNSKPEQKAQEKSSVSSKYHNLYGSGSIPKKSQEDQDLSELVSPSLAFYASSDLKNTLTSSTKILQDNNNDMLQSNITPADSDVPEFDITHDDSSNISSVQSYTEENDNNITAYAKDAITTRINNHFDGSSFVHDDGIIDGDNVFGEHEDIYITNNENTEMNIDGYCLHCTDESDINTTYQDNSDSDMSEPIESSPEYSRNDDDDIGGSLLKSAYELMGYKLLMKTENNSSPSLSNSQQSLTITNDNGATSSPDTEMMHWAKMIVQHRKKLSIDSEFSILQQYSELDSILNAPGIPLNVFDKVVEWRHRHEQSEKTKKWSRKRLIETARSFSEPELSNLSIDKEGSYPSCKNTTRKFGSDPISKLVELPSGRKTNVTMFDIRYLIVQKLLDEKLMDPSNLLIDPANPGLNYPSDNIKVDLADVNCC